MTDLLDQGAAWLDGKRKAYMSRTVVYARGATSFVVQATIGRTLFERSDADGIQTTWESRDYLISAEDIREELFAAPAAGDTITETDDAGIFIYEVMAPPGEQVWRYSDGFRRCMRIHTKQKKCIPPVVPISAIVEVPAANVTFNGNLTTVAVLNAASWGVTTSQYRYSALTASALGETVTLTLDLIDEGGGVPMVKYDGTDLLDEYGRTIAPFEFFL